MRNLTLTILLLLVASVTVKAQTQPKQHVFYDTVKVVKERIDYAPDTIPVFFKEIIVSGGQVTEKWVSGFIVWQTYKKYSSNQMFSGLTYNGQISLSNPPYYKDEFEPTKFSDAQYLYEDKRKVTNKVLYTLKR